MDLEHLFFGWSLLGSMSPLSGRSPFSQLQKVNDVALLLLKNILTNKSNSEKLNKPKHHADSRRVQGGWVCRWPVPRSINQGLITIHMSSSAHWSWKKTWVVKRIAVVEKCSRSPASTAGNNEKLLKKGWDGDNGPWAPRFWLTLVARPIHLPR